MKLETWKKLRREVFLDKICFSEFPPNIIHIPLIDVRWKGMRFIEFLLNSGVPLEDIEINDWNTTLVPRIWVLGKEYFRFPSSERTRKLALEAYRRRKQKLGS